jgi:ADP-heptose:LPS heptosyltransferase
MFNRLWNKFIFSLFYYIFKVASSIAPPVGAELDRTSFRRILIISAAGIGDSLSDSPAIRAVKETYPQAAVTVLTHKRRALVASHNPYIDELVLHKKGFISFIRNALYLRNKGFDLVIVLRANDPDIWPLAYLVNRRAVLSCPVMTRMEFLISHPVILPDWDHTHGVEQTLDIVRHAGAGTEDKGMVYKVTDDELRDIDEKLREMGLQDRPLVAFQVGGGKKGGYRDWGYANYIEVGRRLLEEFDAALLLTGGNDNLDKARRIEDGLKGREMFSLVGKLSLAQTAALLKRCRVLLSTDTGIMHLGFAVGDVDVLCLLHCYTPASRVGPYGYGDKHTVIQLTPPEGRKPSRDMKMDGIRPETVYDKLAENCIRKGIGKRGYES